MTAKTATKSTVRFLPFDRLRYLMIILVVLQHSAASYGNLVTWWYVRDPANSINPFFDLFRQLPDIIMMPVLFFLAGFFALPSLQQQGLKCFLQKKCIHLLEPWLVCVILIVPPIHYIYHVSRADLLSQKGFYYYWAQFLQDTMRFHVGFIDSMDQFNQNFTWFISLLFFFFMFFALGHAIKIKLVAGINFPSKYYSTLEHKPHETLLEKHKNNTVSGEPRNHNPGYFALQEYYPWIIIISIGSLCSFSYYIINSYMPYERWIIIFNVIQFQSPRLIIYISYFGMGVYAFSQQWFLQKPPPGKLLFWASASGILSLIFFYIQPEHFSGSSRTDVSLFYSLIRYFLCLSLLFLLLLSTCRYLTRPSVIHDFLTNHSYYVYLSHFLLVVAAQLFFRQFINLDSIIKFCGVLSFSIIGSYLLSYFVLKPFPRISLLIILFFCLALGYATG